MDDDIVTCPYEKSHRIHKSRLQYHLVKCKKQHLTVKKIICPLNNCHLVNSSDIKEHLATCSNLSDLTVDEFEENVNVVAPIADIDMPKQNDDWDMDPVPATSYNAMENAANRNVLRCAQGLSKAERKKFKNAERLRIANMNGISVGKPLPAKDMTKDMPIRPPSSIPAASTRNIETMQKNLDTSKQIHEPNTNNYKCSNPPVKLSLVERLSLSRNSQGSKNMSTAELLSSSSTKSIKDISIKNVAVDNYNTNVTNKSINDSRCFSDGKENSSIYDKNRKMSAKEKQKDSLTEVNQDWQTYYLHNLGLNNINLKEDELLDIASNSRGQTDDDSFNLSKIMSSTKYAKSVDEMDQIDQIDRNSISSFIKLKDQLNTITDIENRVTKEKARITEELNNLTFS